MGTRSIVLVTGSDGHDSARTVRLYKHYDGYPSEFLNILADALADVRKVLKKHDEKVARTYIVVGKIMGADTGFYGMGIKIDEDYTENFSFTKAQYNEPLHSRHFGSQGDLEWIYVVDTFHKNVSVYAGTGNPAEINLTEFTDPSTYAARFKGIAKEEVEAEIAKGVARLSKSGFTVNKETE